MRNVLAIAVAIATVVGAVPAASAYSSSRSSAIQSAAGQRAQEVAGNRATAHHVASDASAEKLPGVETFCPYPPNQYDNGCTGAPIECVTASLCGYFGSDPTLNFGFNPTRLPSITASSQSNNESAGQVICVLRGSCYGFFSGRSAVVQIHLRKGFLPAPERLPASAPERHALSQIAGGGVGDIACPSSTECVVVHDNYEESFNPLRPEHVRKQVLAPRTFVCLRSKKACKAAPGKTEPTYLVDVACPSASECITPGETGDVIRFNPRAPGHLGMTAVTPQTWQEASVACGSASSCVMADPGGDPSGLTWFDPSTSRVVADVKVAPSPGVWDGSDPACSSATRCSYLVARGHVWSAVTIDLPSRRVAHDVPVLRTGRSDNGLLCPSASLCIAEAGSLANTFDPR